MTLGPSIFWVTVSNILVILALITIVGRPWSRFLPKRLQPNAGFFLAPAFGLATVVVVASLLGRWFPMGDTALVPLVTAAMLLAGLLLGGSPIQAVRHVVQVGAFGLVCASSGLALLAAIGGMNAHNDAFTYLAHSQWLQTHPFGARIGSQEVTPLNTQVAIYQYNGFRMGASYALAYFQALLNQQWAYYVYPAVVLAPIAACCLALACVLGRVWRRFSWPARWMLLALPSFSLGGLVFGANFGFLPQTFGLALGGAALFLHGGLLERLKRDDGSRWIAASAAIPIAVLLAAAVYAYSELATLLAVAVLASAIWIAFRERAWRAIGVYLAVMGIVAAMLLNAELVRALAALRTQSGAVVGWGIDWRVIGFLGHALGLHGGALDGLQWASVGGHGREYSYVFVALTVTILAVVISQGRNLGRAVSAGILLPTTVLLGLLVAGFVYFRYGVASPFPVGQGQSWSQFKLAEWAHPFATVVVLYAMAAWWRQLGRRMDMVVVLCGGVLLTGAVYAGALRSGPLRDYYTGVNDLASYYLDLRRTVLEQCRQEGVIYLALGGEHYKFRQMAVLHLDGFPVRSDWSDDGYIFPILPLEARTQSVVPRDCLAEPVRANGMANTSGVELGPLRIGKFIGGGALQIAGTAGAYDREGDAHNWWHWVERSVTFRLVAPFQLQGAHWTRVRFEYGTQTAQVLRIQLTDRAGNAKQEVLSTEGPVGGVFEKTWEIAPGDVAELTLESLGEPVPLGKGDPRRANFIVRNLSVVSESAGGEAGG